MNNTLINATETKELVLKNSSIETRFRAIDAHIVAFDITSSGQAKLDTVLSRSAGDTVKVYQYLQRYNKGRWSSIKSWSDTSTRYEYMVGNTVRVSKGYTYRLKSIAYVYDDGRLIETSLITSKEIRY